MKKRALILALAGIMAASLIGCGSRKDDAVVVKAGDEEITAGVANFYARYTQAQYETYFASYFGGDDMWTKNASDGKTYEESIKETLLDDLKNMALLEKHMKDYDVKLTKADKKAIDDAAEEFDKANSQKKKDKVSGSEENVKRVMTLMVIEQKMRSAIVAEANVNVTDEEAVEAFEYLSRTEGIIPAIVTPIDEDGKLNLKLLEKQAGYLLDGGVQGLFACGGTGEGAYLKTEEKRLVFHTLKQMLPEDKFLCAALINSNTRAVADEIAALGDLEADYIVATAPYYHAASQADILEHYMTIAKKSPVPLIVYNIPSTTHNYIEPETINKLIAVKNIAGVKDSSGNFMNYTRGLFENQNKEFAWIQGEDYLCGANFLAGADGVVSGLSNVRIEPYVEMYEAFLNNDARKIKECQVKINKLYKLIHLYGNGNASIKAATELYGRGSRWMQQSSMSLDDTQMAEIKKILDEYER